MKPFNNMTIYTSVPVRILIKMWHVRKKIGGKRGNRIANSHEEVVNNRGLAYAYRNRLIYRKRKDRDRKFGKKCQDVQY